MSCEVTMIKFFIWKCEHQRSWTKLTCTADLRLHICQDSSEATSHRQREKPKMVHKASNKQVLREKHLPWASQTPKYQLSDRKLFNLFSNSSVTNVVSLFVDGRRWENMANKSLCNWVNDDLHGFSCLLHSAPWRLLNETSHITRGGPTVTTDGIQSTLLRAHSCIL